MKPIGLLTVLVMLLLVTTTVSVAASGYPPDPGIKPPSPTPGVTGPPGAPALSGSQMSGLLSVTYPNGHPVTLTQTMVTLQLCVAGACTSVTATLSQTVSGTYSYSFTVPSTVSGAVSIVVTAGSLTDEYGTSFPSVNTVVGTFSITSSPPAIAGSPLTSKSSSSPMDTTNPTVQTAQP